MELVDDASLLIVVVETNPMYWASQKGKSSGTAAAQGLKRTIEQLLVFLNSFMVLNQQNRCAVIAVHADSCHYLYTTPEPDEIRGGGTSGFPEDQHCSNKIGGLDPLQNDASAVLMERLRKLDPKKDEAAALAAGKAPSIGGPVTSPFAGALSLALCYCHRLMSTPLFSAKPRILCLQGSEDSPSQYVAMMNAIFSAQRVGIPIDSCILGDYDSAFLQQAAHLTNGIYYKPHRGKALLQYMLSVSGVDLFTRQHIRLTASRAVDFRASCFCHKRPIEIGYVCSVCLSIFCEERLVCPTCGADYKASTSHMQESGGRRAGGGDEQ